MFSRSRIAKTRAGRSLYLFANKEAYRDSGKGLCCGGGSFLVLWLDKVGEGQREGCFCTERLERVNDLFWKWEVNEGELHDAVRVFSCPNLQLLICMSSGQK